MEKAQKNTRKNGQPLYDEAWIQRRLKYRPGLTSAKSIVDLVTGYLDSPTERGFTAKRRQALVFHYRRCRNFAEVCRAVGVQQAAVLDAIATDTAFRRDFVACLGLAGRAQHIQEGFDDLGVTSRGIVLNDLSDRAKQYE